MSKRKLSVECNQRKGPNEVELKKKVQGSINKWKRIECKQIELKLIEWHST